MFDLVVKSMIYDNHRSSARHGEVSKVGALNLEFIGWTQPG
jgi:hypothetical protein